MTHIRDPKPDPTLFRCEHFGFVAEMAECRSRQVEKRAIEGETEIKPAYPYCHSGRCLQGNKISGRGLHVVEAITPPAEEQMAKRKPAEKRKPRECCGSLGPRHKSGCPAVNPKARAEVKKPTVISRTKKRVVTLLPEAKPGDYNVTEASVEDLIFTIAKCKEELVNRRVRLETQLKEVAEALDGTGSEG